MFGLYCRFMVIYCARGRRCAVMRNRGHSLGVDDDEVCLDCGVVGGPGPGPFLHAPAAGGGRSAGLCVVG